MKNNVKDIFLVQQLTMILAFLFLVGCQGDIQIDNPEDFISALPENIIYPADNPYSAKKEELGRMLYWDPILSGTKEVACVTCHHPNLGYADGIKFSHGVGASGLGPERSGGLTTRRNAPTVINTAFNGIDNEGIYNPKIAPMFWDNRVESLEGQALMPMLSKEEMRGDLISEEVIMDTIVNRLSKIPQYVDLFEQSFGVNNINQTNILAAIATFERGIVANNSRFDQYMRGDVNALTDYELQGMNNFIAVGCADCHSGPMFSDYELHTIGVPDNISPADPGANNQFEFRTPTLRNLDLTGPYMHNGIHETLEDVMEFYEAISEGDAEELNSNVTEADLSEEMQDLDLPENQIDEIIAFMQTLNDDSFDKTIPASVPSGLPVGGNIE